MKTADFITPDRPHHRDYTESMATDTLLKIRADLAKNPLTNNPHTWEGKRFARIGQVLRSRRIFVEIETKPMKMKPTPKKKERAHNHTPVSWTQKPAPLSSGMTADELAKAKQQAAKFLKQ